MRLSLATFVVVSLTLGSVLAAPGLTDHDSNSERLHRVPRSPQYEYYTRSMHRLARGAPPPARSTGPLDWSFKPVQVKIDLERDNPNSVPVVVVPVPVPVPGACDAGVFNQNAGGGVQYDVSPVQQQGTSSRRPYPGASAPPAPPAPEREREPTTARLPPPLPDSPYAGQSYAPEEDYSKPPPRVEPVASSQRLVEEFQAQTPRAPDLPPMLLSGFDASERMRIPDGGNAHALEAEEKEYPEPPQELQQVRTSFGSRGRPPGSPFELTARSPPPAYHPESLRVIRGHVTVPRADYTEPYTVWFDEKNGNARVDFHGGSTSTFRMTMSDGRVRRAVVWAQRSGSADMRRCAMVTTPQGSTPTVHPALPDLAGFTYAGKEEMPFGTVEVWQRTVEGRPGEKGAARGEALTTHHEMRLTRLNGAAVPLRYTVSVNSTTLGPNCDGYEHFYQSESSKPFPPDFFNVDLEKFCDTIETLDPSSAEDVAKLEPLREFTLPHRDERYNQVFDDYRAQYARQYADEKEEAVRKNVVMQSGRFVAAGNRQGATSELGSTLLADRLRVEVRRIMGAEGAAAALANGPKRESFPYSREEVRMQERRLPTGFDWRPRGGVSPVGFQGFKCASCWAFAVSGAVEGALFRRTRRLVPLSYQCLVDCAHPFGGNGCEGTWPAHAYNYVQERGLPALDEYPPYKEKVGQCEEQRVPSQTRISGHVNVTSNSVPALKIAIRKHAPSVVIVDADCQSFILHKKGVLYDDRCGKALRQLHHAVLAVGWGERRGEPHFILKNSWSAKWGENGYIRVHAGSNTCGVLTMPSYPVLEEDDVRQPLRAGARPQRSRFSGSRTRSEEPYPQIDLEDEFDFD